MPNEWHHVHLGSRAAGGVGLVMVEASAVVPDGRISPQDMGIWSDRHADAFRPITAFLKKNGSTPAIQLAHAGRKASTTAPWLGGLGVSHQEGGWTPVGPGAETFDTGYIQPRRLAVEELRGLVDSFASAARRSIAAGFEVIEVHAAHGYLLHEFLTPLVNRRDDNYGGSLENRMRLTLEVSQAVREAVPSGLPVLVRISATDWVDGGWDIEQSIELSKRLKRIGIDLIDCSSGGAVPDAKIATGPGYQADFAARIRSEAAIATAAVGLITEPRQAEQLLTDGAADAILLGRQLLREPYFAFRAARELGADIAVPKQYGRGILIRG